MPSINSSGTQTCTIGTEHTLATLTGPHGFRVQCNGRNLVLGESARVLIYNKTLTGDTITTGTTDHVEYPMTLQGGSGQPAVESPPFEVAYSAVVTVTQLNGTGRDIYFNIVQLD